MKSHLGTYVKLFSEVIEYFSRKSLVGRFFFKRKVTPSNHRRKPPEESTKIVQFWEKFEGERVRESTLKMVERIVEEEKSSEADYGMTVVAFASCHRTFVTGICKNIDIQCINKIFNTSVGAVKRLSGLADGSFKWPAVEAAFRLELAYCASGWPSPTLSRTFSQLWKLFTELQHRRTRHRRYDRVGDFLNLCSTDSLCVRSRDWRNKNKNHTKSVEKRNMDGWLEVSCLSRKIHVKRSGQEEERRFQKIHPTWNEKLHERAFLPNFEEFHGRWEFPSIRLRCETRIEASVAPFRAVPRRDCDVKGKKSCAVAENTLQKIRYKSSFT